MFRIIPKLEVKGNNLVKGINLEGLRILGDPNYFILKYYKDGADEIFIQDVVASLYNRYSLLNIIKNISKECFIPITIGGGISSIKDIELLLTNGADRVSLNSGAFLKSKLISKIVKKFGSSTLSLNVQAMQFEKKFVAYYNNGRTSSGIEIKDWIKKIQNEGVGEIVLTSINKEGMMKGFDTELLDSVRNLVKVPLLFNGGASCPEDILKLKSDYDIQGVVISSLIHYNFFKDPNTEQKKINVNVKNNLPKIKTYKINEIKNFLMNKNIQVRI